MRGWKDLELVETIYEEEDHEHEHDHKDQEDHEEQEDEDEDEDGYYSSDSPSLSPTLTPSPPTPLHSISNTWSLATGIQTDVVVHVQDQSFRLHKDPLISKSGYFKKHLMDSNEITLSPPLNITPDTFSSIVDYCYTYQIVITPFNVAALRVAANLLDMSADNGNNNLHHKTETYFNHAVSVNQEYARIVLRSCLALLPDADSASMASKCIEMLTLTEDIEDVNGWVDQIMSLTTNKFQLIADSLNHRSDHNHDLLYRITDLYLQEHAGKITEEEKTMICSCVDCNRLSPHLIMHAVQNPRMPLRFIVRAMLVEQLNTRRSIISTTTSALNTHDSHPCSEGGTKAKAKAKAMTLGAILQRDAAFRQVVQLKATMEATSMKIETLEKDLMSMKRVLDSSKKRSESTESGRSASFRFSSERKIGKEERGGNSSSLRFFDRKDRGGGSSSSSSPEIPDNGTATTKGEKSFGWKLMKGFKHAVLRISSPISKHNTDSVVSSKLDGDGLRDVEENGAIVVYKEDNSSHRRSRSLV